LEVIASLLVNQFMVKPYYIYGCSVYYIYGQILLHLWLVVLLHLWLNVITFMVKFYYIYGWYYIYGFYYIYGPDRPEVLIVRFERSEVRTKRLRTERKEKRFITRLTVKKNAKKS